MAVKKPTEAFLNRALSEDAMRMAGALTRTHVVKAPMPWDLCRVATDGHRMHAVLIAEPTAAELEEAQSPEARGIVAPLPGALAGATRDIEPLAHVRTARQIRAACDRAEAIAEARWHRARAVAIEAALARNALPDRESLPAKMPGAVLIGDTAVNAEYLKDALVGLSYYATPKFRVSKNELDPVVVIRGAGELAVIMPIRLDTGEAWPEIGNVKEEP